MPEPTSMKTRGGGECHRDGHKDGHRYSESRGNRSTND